MGLIVGALETFGGQVRIDLGCHQMGVAKQFLHAAQIGPGIQQVGGKAVAQVVRGRFWDPARRRGDIFSGATARCAASAAKPGAGGRGKPAWLRRVRNAGLSNRREWLPAPERRWARTVPFFPCPAPAPTGRASPRPPREAGTTRSRAVRTSRSLPKWRRRENKRPHPAPVPLPPRASVPGRALRTDPPVA